MGSRRASPIRRSIRRRWGSSGSTLPRRWCWRIRQTARLPGNGRGHLSSRYRLNTRASKTSVSWTSGRKTCSTRPGEFAPSSSTRECPFTRLVEIIHLARSDHVSVLENEFVAGLLGVPERRSAQEQQVVSGRELPADAREHFILRQPIDTRQPPFVPCGVGAVILAAD